MIILDNHAYVFEIVIKQIPLIVDSLLFMVML